MTDRSITYTMAARVAAYVSPMAEAAAVTELVETKQRQLTATITRGSVLQAAATTSSAAAQSSASATQVAASGRQTAAIERVGLATRADSVAQASSTSALRANTAAREQATVAARAQQAATMGLSSANGLLGTSMSPLTAGLGATALGFGYAAFRGMEFDSAMAEVRASSGETGAGLEDLRNLAIDLGADTKYSSEEAAQGITELSKAGVDSADIMGGALAGSLDLAAAGGLGVGQAAEIAATQLTVFNLSGGQASHVADLLAAGAGKAQGSVEDMALALQYAGLPAAGLGLSIEETTGSLALFASNGLIGEKAGTSFRGMLVSMTNPVGKTREVMDELGLSFFDATGRFIGMDGVADQLQDQLGGLSQETRNAALAQIFGNEALGAAQILYNSGSAGVERWTRAVNDAGYAQEYAADLSDTLRGDLERLGGAVDATMTSVGSGAQGPLRLFVQGLTAVVEAGGDVLAWVESIPEPVAVAGAAFVAMLVATGPIVRTVQGLGFAMNLLAVSSAPAVAIVRAAGMAAVGSTQGMAAFGLATASARTALVGFLTTATPFIAVAAVSAGVVSILQADKAATDARDSIEALLAPIDKADTTSTRMAAQAASINELRDLAEQAQSELEDYENRSTFEKIWEWGAPDDPGDALRKAAETTAAALDDQTAAVDRADQSIEVLGRRYGMSRDSVIAFADAHGIDLTGSLQIAQTEFMRLADAAGMTQYAATSATAAAGSYGALLMDVGQQASTSADELQDWLDAVRAANEGFIDPLNTYTGLLDQKREAERASAQATADATADQSDSWSDYVADVSVSLDEYAGQLRQQIDAQRNWQSNLAIIAQRGGVEVATALMEMGVQGADLVAQMATANEGEFTNMASTLIEQAQLASSGSNAAMSTGLQVMAAIGRQGASATVESIAHELGLGVEQVAGIVGQYGVTLADGVNPVLRALGQQAVTVVRGVFGFTNADGNVVHYANGGAIARAANGGRAEDHTAQHAPAGAMRVWAEPETPGPSFIPPRPAPQEAAA